MKRNTIKNQIAIIIALVFVMGVSAQNRSNDYTQGRERERVESRGTTSSKSGKSNSTYTKKQKDNSHSSGVDYTTRGKSNSKTTNYTSNYSSKHHSNYTKKHGTPSYVHSKKGSVHVNIVRHGNDRHFNVHHKAPVRVYKSKRYYPATEVRLRSRIEINGINYYVFDNRVHRRTFSGRFVEVIPPAFTYHLPLGTRLVNVQGHFHYYNNGLVFIRTNRGFEIRIA